MPAKELFQANAGLAGSFQNTGVPHSLVAAGDGWWVRNELQKTYGARSDYPGGLALQAFFKGKIGILIILPHGKQINR